MGGVSTTATSIEAVNRIFQATSTKALAAADKLMKYTVALSVGKESGKGEQIDLTA